MVRMGLPDDIEVSEPMLTGGEWVKLGDIDLEEACRKEEQLNRDIAKAAANYKQNTNPPKCLHKWSWGAFVFSGIWGLFNRVYWPIITGVVLGVICGLIGSEISGVAYIAMFVISIVLGINGNKMAWEKAKADGVDSQDFDKGQKGWQKAGIVVAIIYGVIIVTIIIFEVVREFSYKSNDNYIYEELPEDIGVVDSDEDAYDNYIFGSEDYEDNQDVEI